MKQHAKWGEKEADQNLKQSDLPASEMLRCRVAWLRQWRNICTGETCQQTIAEFAQSKGISLQVVYAMTQKTCPRIASGWKHDGRLRRVIQGNGLDWLACKSVRNGSPSMQAKEKVSVGWDYSIRVIALYRKGYGIKRIAKEFGINAASVMRVLSDTGINTSARRNYGDRNAKALRTFSNSRERYHRMMADDAQRLKKRLMSRIWSAMKRQRVNGAGAFALVGCTVEQLREHIAKQFTEGMTFENYGEWHVDHIRPCASFDLNDPEQLKTCFNWQNLQPLWAADNLRKKDSYAQG